MSSLIKLVTWLDTLIVSSKSLHLSNITYNNTVRVPIVIDPAFTEGRGLTVQGHGVSLESAYHGQEAGISIQVFLPFPCVMDWIVCMTPKVVCWSSDTRFDGIWRWCLGWMRSWGWGSHEAVSLCCLFSAVWGHSEKTAPASQEESRLFLSLMFSRVSFSHCFAFLLSRTPVNWAVVLLSWSSNFLMFFHLFFITFICFFPSWKISEISQYSFLALILNFVKFCLLFLNAIPLIFTKHIFGSCMQHFICENIVSFFF